MVRQFDRVLGFGVVTANAVEMPVEVSVSTLRNQRTAESCFDVVFVGEARVFV